MDYTDKDRLLEMTTVLGDDVLLLSVFKGVEEISRPFQFSIEAFSTNVAITSKDLVGTSVTIAIHQATLNDEGETQSEKIRYFNGIVRQLSAGPISEAVENQIRFYKLEVVPWLWILSLQSDCRVFQHMSIPDVVSKVFDDAGFSGKYTWKASSSDYQPQEYCVQYRETMLDFVSRLLEQAGIYYYFEQKDKEHTLILGDQVSNYMACEPDKAPFSSLKLHQNDRAVTSWEHQYSLIPGKYSHTDYNFQTPTTSLSKSTPSIVKDVSGRDSYAHYDFPGVYLKGDEGEKIAVRRMQEYEASYDVILGKSTFAGFFAGGKFTLSDHPSATENKLVAIRSIEHIGRQSYAGVTRSQSNAPAEEYSNSFSAIPGTVVYRPPRTTPVPIVRGPQSAIVVGASGEEISTDNYGRVKIQFIWDRLGKSDETSSCYVRVAQAWAGNNWGVMFTPRVGNEVLVDFLEGNPDRPIITGCVYNAVNLPPYELADDKGVAKDGLTYSGIKTYSSAKGESSNFNELRFQDALGKEEIFFHAERDFVREVENDDKLTVGIENDSDGSPAIGLAGKATGNQTITIFNNQTLTIGKKIGKNEPTDGSQIVEIWKNQTVTIGKGGSDCQDGSQTVDIWKNQTVTIGKGKNDCGDGSQTMSIHKDQSVKIGNNMTLDIGSSQAIEGSQTVNIWKARTVTLKTGDDKLSISQGNQTIKIDVGSSSLEALQSITFKVGDSSIKIAPEGITIKGTLITIQAQAELKAKAPLCTVAADGILTLKGGLLKLN